MKYQKRRKTRSLSTPKKASNMSDVSTEITIRILTKLPKESLLRFKIVSKQWNSWISCPQSELSKQRRQVQEPGAIACLQGDQGNNRLSFRLIDQQLNVQNLENPFPKNYKDELIKSSEHISIKFLGSCDGLVLISVNDDIFLWNPATRFFTKVNELILLTSDDHVISAGGLCYDSSKKEYKVLLYVYNKCPYDSDGAYALVASLKDKKWRDIDCNYDYWSVRDGVAMDGRLYSRANKENDYFDRHEELVGRYSHDRRQRREELRNMEDSDDGSGDDEDDDVSDDEDEDVSDDEQWERYKRFGPRNEVIYFDAISEQFHSLYKRDKAIVGLGILNECLCVTCVDFDKSLEISIMKEHAVEKSWIPLFVIRNSEITRPYRFDGTLFMTKDGELALIVHYHDDDYYGHDDYDNIVAYDPKNDSMKEILKIENQKAIPIITYVESLLSPTEYYWSDEMRSQKYYHDC